MTGLASLVSCWLLLAALAIVATRAQSCQPWDEQPPECRAVVGGDALYNTTANHTTLVYLVNPANETAATATQLVSAIRMYDTSCRHALLSAICSVSFPPCGLYASGTAQPLVPYCTQLCDDIQQACQSQALALGNTTAAALTRALIAAVCNRTAATSCYLPPAITGAVPVSTCLVPPCCVNPFAQSPQTFEWYVLLVFLHSFFIFSSFSISLFFLL
jgi:hypothetical protein